MDSTVCLTEETLVRNKLCLQVDTRNPISFLWYQAPVALLLFIISNLIQSFNLFICFVRELWIISRQFQHIDTYHVVSQSLVSPSIASAPSQSCLFIQYFSHTSASRTQLQREQKAGIFSNATEANSR